MYHKIDLTDKDIVSYKMVHKRYRSNQQIEDLIDSEDMQTTYIKLCKNGQNPLLNKPLFRRILWWYTNDYLYYRFYISGYEIGVRFYNNINPLFVNKECILYGLKTFYEYSIAILERNEKSPHLNEQILEDYKVYLNELWLNIMTMDEMKTGCISLKDIDEIEESNFLTKDSFRILFKNIVKPRLLGKIESILGE